jgi:hypothetical protein
MFPITAQEEADRHLHQGFKDRDNPWYGVSEHNLGRVPMVIEFCWPEIRDANTLDPDSDTGRLGGLPLMWAGFSTWKEICRNFSMLNNLLYKTATAPLISNIETIDDQWGNSDIIYAEGDQKAVYATPPQVQQQIVEIMGRLQSSWDKGTFLRPSPGWAAATSGRERNMVLNAGGVRFDHVVRKIGRAWSGTIEGITEILRSGAGTSRSRYGATARSMAGCPTSRSSRRSWSGTPAPAWKSNSSGLTRWWTRADRHLQVGGRGPPGGGGLRPDTGSAQPAADVRRYAPGED